MNTTFTYDAADKKQRSVWRRFRLCQFVVLLLLMPAFALAFAIGFAVLFGNLQFAWAFLLPFLCVSTVFLFLLALIMVPTAGSQSMCVEFREHDFLITVSDKYQYDKKRYEIQYGDIERIYIDKFTELSFCRKIGIGYVVCFETRVEKTNGKTVQYPKKQVKQFPMVYSLDDVNTILSIVGKKRRDQS